MKRITLLVLLVLAIASATTTSYAYWDKMIIQESVSIQIGSWQEGIPAWNSGTNYIRGQKVTYNGKTYEALSNNPPYGPGNFWLGWLFWRQV